MAKDPGAFWGVLLPYMYGGGRVWLDGELVGEVPTGGAGVHVRWERPHLLVLPRYLVRAGVHELSIQAHPVQGETVLNFPAPRLGPLSELRAQYDRRYFWMHTMPELTVSGCLVVTILVLLIWWRLPQEVLYGWFGVATLMWGLRTLTFVIETMPADRWPWWRLVYLASTGGFIVVLALFACRLAEMRSRWAQRTLLAYWAIGPAWLLLQGQSGDAVINRLWTAGLIPIAVGVVVVSFIAVRRQRTGASLLLSVALTVATLTGVHDYLIVWRPAVLSSVAASWVAQRYFLLHYGADFVLVAMGLVLCTRFIQSVNALQVLNETLESRVAERESELAANFARMAELERESAASGERKLIMREIHDGLGSKLFTSLSRVERGAMDATQMAQTLRACIADMRLALEALSPDDQDLITAFGDFMFRWQTELRAASVHCEWVVDVPGDALPMAPHATLQVLRVAQEALTNVAKHAGARRVDLALTAHAGRIELRIADDGVGIRSATGATGHGLDNMHARAQQLAAMLVIERRPVRGTVVTLTLPSTLLRRPHATVDPSPPT